MQWQQKSAEITLFLQRYLQEFALIELKIKLPESWTSLLIYARLVEAIQSSNEILMPCDGDFSIYTSSSYSLLAKHYLTVDRR